MKKVTLLLMLMMSSMIFSQEYEVKNGAIVMTKVIETGMSIKESHDAAETFFATAYNNSNKTIRVNNDTHLIYSGLFMNVASHIGGLWVIDYEHMVDVSIKEGKIRIQVSCDKLIYRGTQSPQKYEFLVVDSYPVSPNAKGVRSFKKLMDIAHPECLKRMEGIIIAFENSLSNKTEEEDW